MPNDKPYHAKINRGYTLIEILVVLTIIGVLFGAGFVGYRDFSRRQSLAGAAKIVEGDLRKAQQDALSGIKPDNIACSGENTLEGYFFSVTSDTTYEIGASCSGGNIARYNITLPENITISAPSPNPIIFKVLGAGTNIPSGDVSIVLTQSGTGATLTIYVGSGGNITQGALIVTSTPTPTTPPLPIVTPTPTPTPAYCNGEGQPCTYDIDCCIGLECSGLGYCIQPALPTPTPPFVGCNGGYGCISDQDCDYMSGEQCLPDPATGQNCCRYP